MSYHRYVNRIRSRNVTLTDLSIVVDFSVEDIGPDCLDAYPSEQNQFFAQAIHIMNDHLAKALAELPQDARDIVLLSFFMDMRDCGTTAQERNGTP